MQSTCRAKRAAACCVANELQQMLRNALRRHCTTAASDHTDGGEATCAATILLTSPSRSPAERLTREDDHLFLDGPLVFKCDPLLDESEFLGGERIARVITTSIQATGRWRRSDKARRTPQSCVVRRRIGSQEVGPIGSDRDLSSRA